MNAWKTVLIVGLLIGLLMVLVAITNAIEFSGPAMFVFYLGLTYGAHVVWDQVIFKNISTVNEIVEKRNVAYAIAWSLPALFSLAAASAV